MQRIGTISRHSDRFLRACHLILPEGRLNMVPNSTAKKWLEEFQLVDSLTSPKYRLAAAWLKSVDSAMTKSMPWPLASFDPGTMAMTKFVEKERDRANVDGEEVVKFTGDG
ncbi:hypothetical protein F3Y22_tig00116997pilonHSYRG00354 [Hibiscus syriacus]|uniref:Uncharacterized protein n=1 Tax=Hibiscus syriacus TaxID=106335 RepID=A0A6A2WLG4_HIBSY|nr:hypothetical protein F3Y22_tig00116997pilonHSYRG00354 [Hibiscus syriacus]